MKNEELIKLGKKIKIIRNQLGLSQEALAEVCAFDRTYISLLERGKRNPSYINLIKLSKGFNMTISKLLEEDN